MTGAAGVAVDVGTGSVRASVFGPDGTRQAVDRPPPADARSRRTKLGRYLVPRCRVGAPRADPGQATRRAWSLAGSWRARRSALPPAARASGPLPAVRIQVNARSLWAGLESMRLPLRRAPPGRCAGPVNAAHRDASGGRRALLCGASMRKRRTRWPSQERSALGC